MAKVNDRKEMNGSALALSAALGCADKMRGHMDASEYKHVCLGLIFLKYISDAFEEKREQLLFGFSDPKSDCSLKTNRNAKKLPRTAMSICRKCLLAPTRSRWHTIKAKAKSPEIGKVIDDAMARLSAKIHPQRRVAARLRPASLDKVQLGDSWTSSATSASTIRRQVQGRARARV